MSAAWLCGCSQIPALPPPAEPNVAPPSWREAASTQAPEAAALAQWWRQFEDPGLDALVAQTLARNPSLRQAQATLRQARAARALAQAARWPQVGASGSASRSQADGAVGVNQFRLGLSASWDSDLSGASSAALGAAEADELAATADLDSVRASLLAELGQAYVQWRSAQARARITRESLASLEDTLALARWRTQAGLASALDVEQSVLATEQARAGLQALESEIAQDEHQLALLSGGPPAAFATPTPADVPAAEPALQRLSVGLPADVLRRRPDLRSAEAALRAAWLRREQTRREGWPGLSLNGSLGLQALSLAGLGQAGAGLATLAASVNWIWLDGGQRAALVDAKDAALERSRAGADAALLAALTDVENALAALRGSRERSASLTLAADAAQASLQLTRHRHSAGLVDFATLLEAQRAELNTRLALQSARAEQSLNLIRVYQALGGGWPADLALAPATRAPS